jgi:hypothetical protein
MVWKTSVVNLDQILWGYYLEWNNKQNIYSCSLKLNIQNSLSEEQIITSLKNEFYKILRLFYASLIIWTVLVIFQVVLLTKKFGKKDLEILKYHYSYGIKGTDLIVFEKKS